MLKKTIWEMGRDSLAEYRSKGKLPLIVVLDNVRSLNNIGSIFRTSDAFLVGQVWLCGISATPPSPEIHKTALGAEESVEWRYFPSTTDAVAELKAMGVTICALEQVNGSVPLDAFRPDSHGRYAIIAGHEVNGVDQRVVDQADICLEIPQEGTKHSLNVAVSTALAIWHFYLALRSNH